MSDDLTFIAGRPGSGRTAALARMRDGYETAGYRVIGMAGATAIEQNLRHLGFGNTTTLATELRRIQTGLTQWDGRTVLIVDGAAAIPTEDLATVIGEAHAAGAKLIIAGDPNQLAISPRPRPAPAVPPPEACFLLELLLAKADRKTVPGDLEEEFTTNILPKRGARRARFWFWTQTVQMIATRNPICRWLLIYGLARFGEWILRKIGS
jgi:hypothetical protein